MAAAVDFTRRFAETFTPRHATTVHFVEERDGQRVFEGSLAWAPTFEPGERLAVQSGVAAGFLITLPAAHQETVLVHAAVATEVAEFEATFVKAPSTPLEFDRVDGQPATYVFREVDGPSKTFQVDIPWLPSFKPGRTLRFDTVPGLSDGLTFALPEQRVPAVRVSVQVDAAAVPGSSFSVHSLLMAKREPKASQFKPSLPLDAVLAKVRPLGYSLGRAAAQGDCYPLSVMAGHEITAEEAAAPSRATTAAVLVVRRAAVGLIVGDDAIGGVPSATVRENEGLPRTHGAAERTLKNWRKSKHWRGQGNASAAFMLGVALHVQRQVVVLELDAEGNVVDPGRVYAQVDGGAMRRSAETIPSFCPVALNEIFEMLRSPARVSLILYDGTCHFDPFSYATPPRPSVAPGNEAFTQSDAVQAAAALDGTLPASGDEALPEQAKVDFFEEGRCRSSRCSLGAGHAGLCSHLRATGKRGR